MRGTSWITVAFGLAVVAGPWGGRASAEPGGLPALPDLPGAAGLRPRATIYVEAPGTDMDRLARVLNHLRKAVRKNGKIKYRTFTTLLEPLKRNLAALRRADSLMAEGRRRLQNLEMEQAITMYKKAVRTLEREFVALVRLRQKTRPLARALRNLAIAYFLHGKAALSKSTLRRLFVVGKERDYAKERFPRQMRKSVADERLMFEELGVSDIEVKTDPPGARIYLNARRKGRGPETVKGAPKGINYITARAPGYRTTTVQIRIEPPKLARVVVKLKRLPADPLPDLVQSMQDLGKAKMTPAQRRLAERLRVDVLILGKAAAMDDQARIALYLYDARLKKLVKGPITTNVALNAPQEKVDGLTSRLFEGVSLKERGFEARTPVFKSWWFWTGASLSGAALLSGIATFGVAVHDRATWRKTALEEDRLKMIRSTTAAGVLLAVGLAGGLATTVLTLLRYRRERAEQDELLVTPAVGPGGVGLTVRGAF